MKDIKHDHKATNKIKTTIFGIFLLLPFLFLLPTGLYYGLNQNAQLSEREYQVEHYYESNEVNDVSDVIIGHIYQITNDSTSYSINTYIECDYLNILEGEMTNYPYQPIKEMPYLQALQFNTAIRLVFSADRTGYINNGTIVFVPKSIESMSNELLAQISETDILVPYYTTERITNDISTSIINAWNSTWQNPLFSWSQNTPFTNSINSFVSWFSIGQNTYIASYLNYIVCMIGIYIVIDIIVVLFTYLTHLFSKEG